MNSIYKLVFQIIILPILICICPLAFSQPPKQIKIVESKDLSQIVNPAIKQDKVIILYVYSSTCAYCNRLEADILSPMLKSGDYKTKVLLRKLMIDSDKNIINFSGESQLTKSFLESYGVKITPTLLFLDKNGRQLSDAIIGYNGDEFYWHYLDIAIEKSNQQLKE